MAEDLRELVGQHGIVSRHRGRRPGRARVKGITGAASVSGGPGCGRVGGVNPTNGQTERLAVDGGHRNLGVAAGERLFDCVLEGDQRGAASDDRGRTDLGRERVNVDRALPQRREPAAIGLGEDFPNWREGRTCASCCDLLLFAADCLFDWCGRSLDRPTIEFEQFELFVSICRI